jgi:hypothetical protein
MVEAYPMTKWVLDHANGVIVTSRHALDLLASHGQESRVGCGVVPLYLELPPPSESQRQSARAAMDVGPDQFLVCSFGFVHERKCSRTLLDAWEIGKPAPSARLVFVGEADGEYGSELRGAVRRHGADVQVTGYVDDDTFHRYMLAADLVVQLRSGSRGESSGAALYAMAYGRPLVVTRHGSLAEIPDDACVHVDLPVDANALATTLRQLAEDAARRCALGASARRWVETSRRPQQAADALAQYLARFNDPATVHWRERLSARTDELARSLGNRAGVRGDEVDQWAEELQRATAPPHDATIERAFASLLPRVASPGSQSSARSAMQAADVLALSADDPRLRTVCGTKVDGVIVSNGNQGMLLYGPYVPIQAGAYRVRVYGEAAGSPGQPFGVLEAVADGGRRKLARQPLADRSSRGSMDGLLGRLDFVVHEALADLEIRVIVPQDTRMAIESIDVVTLGASQASPST